MGFLERLKHYRVLDPACGSGNFLYLALKALKDVEHQANLEAEALGLERQIDVTGPHNVLGIELNEYAAELARVTVWIGELQWRIQRGYAFKLNPVLEPLDHIECRDAVLDTSAWAEPHPFGAGSHPVRAEPHSVRAEPVEAPTSTSTSSVRTEEIPVRAEPHPVRAEPVEAQWPKADAVVGNPPFVGDKKMRAELGDAYTEALRKAYAGRVPGGADFVCYWFERARAEMAAGRLKRAGLVSTQAIRSGSSRLVLLRLIETAPILGAWSDEPWSNNGAAVRVSLVWFGSDDGLPVLDGEAVMSINADLSAGSATDLSRVAELTANEGSVFIGTQQNGPFTIPGATARQWLKLPVLGGRSMADVIRPWRNGRDIATRESDEWIIDFGTSIPETDAALFEQPFGHVEECVKPLRLRGNRESRKRLWWRLGEPMPALRKAIEALPRFIATPRVAKHRFFVFLHSRINPDCRLTVIARADDSTLGVLESRVHQLWSLATASMHGVGNDPTYNAKSCFNTFPFPEHLTPADTAHQRTEPLDGGALIPADLPPAVRPHAEAIARAAQRLVTLRDAWLNPPEWTERVPEVVPLGLATSPYPDRVVARPGFEAQLAKRTLTNLYNLRPAWLAQAHEALDAAVAAAYGWADWTAQMPDDEILRRLLALNRERAAAN